MNYYDIEIFDYLKNINDLSFLDFKYLKDNPDVNVYSDIENILSNTDKKIYRDELEKSIYRVGKSMKRIKDDQNILTNNVTELLKVPQPEQRSKEWYETRERMITASDWAGAIGKNPYASRNKTLLRKLGYAGEKFTGNSATRWGQKYEQVATMIYEEREKLQIIEFGCIPHPNIHFLGASPDGISKDGIMLEIKCPPKRKITGIPPIYYWIQVQGQLEVCDLERCDFLECKLMEYDSDDDYFNDMAIVNGFPKSKKYSMECGMILEFKKGENLHFEYSKIGITFEESNIWISEKIKETKKEGYSFCGSVCWYLEKISCVPIFRDRDWFNENLKKLESFWNDWQFYKKNGYEILLKNKRNKPKDGNKMLETNLLKYDGFFKKFDEVKIDEKEFNKLNLGFMQGIPIQSFAFSKLNEKELNKLNEEDNNERYNNENKADLLDYSDDDDINNFVVEKFLFSDFKKTTELIEKKSSKTTKSKNSSKFLFSSL